MAFTPPAVGPQASLMIGTCYINYKDGGWSETYYLNTPGSSGPPGSPATYAAAAANFFALLTARSYLLGANCQIAWARVSASNTLRDSVAAIFAPIGSQLVDTELAISGTENINDEEVGFLWRCEDGLGNHEQRLIRGLRDSWVTDQTKLAALTQAAVSAGGVSAITPVPILPLTLTGNQALVNFLILLGTYCVGKKPTPLAAPNLWFTWPFNNIIYRYVGSRKTGRPFGMFRGRALTQV